jgi:hypothetical protein
VSINIRHGLPKVTLVMVIFHRRLSPFSRPHTSKGSANMAQFTTTHDKVYDH